MAKGTRNRRAWRSAERRDGRNARVADRARDERDAPGNGAVAGNGRTADGAATPVRARKETGAGHDGSGRSAAAPGANGRSSGAGRGTNGRTTEAGPGTNGRTIETGPDANGRTIEAGPGANGRTTKGRAGADGAALLTPDQIKRIEQRLLQERELALRTLVGTRTDIQRHRISDMRKEEMDIHLAERHSEFLALIDSALRRLRESPADFHLSVVSGRPIPFERLEMVPWTRRLTNEMGLPARWSES